MLQVLAKRMVNEVSLLLKILQLMEMKFFDLDYTIIKNRDEKELGDDISDFLDD